MFRGQRLTILYILHTKSLQWWNSRNTMISQFPAFGEKIEHAQTVYTRPFSLLPSKGPEYEAMDNYTCTVEPLNKGHFGTRSVFFVWRLRLSQRFTNHHYYRQHSRYPSHINYLNKPPRVDKKGNCPMFTNPILLPDIIEEVHTLWPHVHVHCKFKEAVCMLHVCLQKEGDIYVHIHILLMCVHVLIQIGKHF